MPRKPRRTRLRSQSLSPNLNWYLHYGDTMSDTDDFTEEDARREWFKHRDEIMRSCPPGPLPYALMAFETSSFATIAGVRSLRLELPGLHDARRAFEDMSSVHPDQAEKFERLAGNVRAVIAEFEGGKQ